jgi:hypothetical protein
MLPPYRRHYVNATDGQTALVPPTRRYSRMTTLSKIGVSSTSSTGTLPSGEISRNQSGLSARTMYLMS